jgi:hypothetical protein
MPEPSTLRINFGPLRRPAQNTKPVVMTIPASKDKVNIFFEEVFITHTTRDLR